jgi:hypothetical protein
MWTVVFLSGRVLKVIPKLMLTQSCTSVRSGPYVIQHKTSEVWWSGGETNGLSACAQKLNMKLSQPWPSGTCEFIGVSKDLTASISSVEEYAEQDESRTLLTANVFLIVWLNFRSWRWRPRFSKAFGKVVPDYTWPHSSTLKKEAGGFSETLVHASKLQRHHLSETSLVGCLSQTHVIMGPPVWAPTKGEKRGVRPPPEFLEIIQIGRRKYTKDESQMRSLCSLCLRIRPIGLWIVAPIFMKLGTCIMAPDTLPVSLPSVCVSARICILHRC